MRRTLLIIATHFVFLLPGVTQQSAFGQNSLSVPTPDTAIGNSPLASYDVSGIDSVNPVNGNLFLQLPLLSFPQRGKTLRLDFKVYYNDKAWSIKYQPGTPSDPNNSQGYGFWQMPVVQGVTVSRDQNLTFWTNTSNFGANLSNGTGGQNVNTAYWSQFVTSPDGSQHYFFDQAQQTCNTYGSGIPCQEEYNTPSNIYPSTDGSGYTPVPVGTQGALNIVDTAGVTYAPGIITDIDGNTIQTNATGWTDSVGPVIPGTGTNPGLPYPTPLAGWGYAEDLVPGTETAPANTPCPAGSKDARIWTVPAPGNTYANYYLCYNDFSYFSNFNLDSVFGNTTYKNVVESGANTARLLTAIILPNLSSYTFSYDNYLSLTQLTLPSGGSVSYTWQIVPFLVPYPISPQGNNWPASPVSRALSTRTVNPGNGEAPQVWSYHWYLNTANSGTVNYAQPSWSVVTDPYGNDTEHQLGGTDAVGNVPVTLVETATAVYSGCSPHDTASNRTCSTSHFALMQSKSYGLTAMVSGGAQYYSPSQVAAYLPSYKQTTTITTIPSAVGNLVSKTVVGLAPKHGSCTVNSLGIMQPGQGSNPPPTTTTSSNCFNYDQQQSAASYDYGIGAPGPLHKTVNTTYLWNSGASSAASYLAANLMDLVSKKTITNAAGIVASEIDFTYDESGYSPAGLHGNLTSLTKVNQQGASPTLHGFYNSNGEMTKAVDGNGGATTIAAFQCGGSLPQTITNALGQASQYTFDCGTGLLTQYQDSNDIANGRAGSRYSYDAIRNPILVSHPDGGSTTISYNAYALPLTVTKTVLASPDPSVISSTVYDGFLKPVQSVLPNGATVETTYDLLGRKQTVTNPHFASVSSTDGTTTMVYDSVGRTIETVNPDGTGLWNCHNGLGIAQQPNCYSAPTGGLVGTWVDNADESGNDWQKLSDAEGELRQVSEPGALVTSYSYDVLGNLQSVNQTGATGQTPRTRTFNYDSLSRLQCASNPENATASCPAAATGSYIAGTTGYFYDTNSNLKTKIDARNITVNYTYDSLNRPYAKSYVNSSGQSSGDPSAYIQYDRPAAGGSDANPIGHMSLEWTGPPSTAPSSSTSNTAIPAGAFTSTTVLSHDTMGRVTSEQQCPLYPCSTAYAFSYAYDLAGAPTQWNNGIASPGTAASPGLVWTASYDAASRINELQTSSQPWTPSTTYPSELINLGLTGTAPSYDPFDHVVNEQASIYPTNSGLPGLEMANVYDDRGRITSEQILGHAAPSTAATNSFGVIAVTGAEQAVGGSFIGTGTVTISGTGFVAMSVSSAPSCSGTFVATPNGSNPPTTGECYTAGGGAFVLVKISTAPGSQGQMLATTQCPISFTVASSNYNIASGIANCINSSGYAGVSAVANNNGVTVTQTAANPSSYIYTLGGSITTSMPNTYSYGTSGQLSYTPLGGADTGTANVTITNGPTKVTTTSSVIWGGSSTPCDPRLGACFRHQHSAGTSAWRGFRQGHGRPEWLCRRPAKHNCRIFRQLSRRCEGERHFESGAPALLPVGLQQHGGRR